MKKLKKVLVFMLVVAMSATMLISCGEPKVKPEESAKIYLDVIFKADKTNMDKIGMKEEDYNTVRKNEEDAFTSKLGTSAASNSLTDESKDELMKNVLTGLTKLEYEVTPVSTDKETAKVNIKINCFELDKIIKNGQQKIIQKVTANPTMTQDEIMKESFKIVGEGFAEGPDKDNTTTVEVGLVKKNNIWVPDDNFEKDVCKVIMAMN